MSSTINYFELLECDSSSNENSDVEIENKSTNSYYVANRHIQPKIVNSEFLNSESTNNKKRYLKKKEIRTNHQPIQDSKKVLYIKRVQSNKVYNEIDNLPSSLDEAVITRQNLTLKQILVLMNLHAMPGMVVNSIHDKIQRQVHKMVVKIAHDSRVFYVSQYHWYDLMKIVSLIEIMFNTY